MQPISGDQISGPSRQPTTVDSTRSGAARLAVRCLMTLMAVVSFWTTSIDLSSPLVQSTRVIGPAPSARAVSIGLLACELRDGIDREAEFLRQVDLA